MKRLTSLFLVFVLVLIHACQPEPVEPDPQLSATPDNISFFWEGGSQSISISANNAWTASVSGTGFSISPTSGEGNGTVTVTAAENSTPDPVSGTVTIKSKGLSAIISLSQKDKPTFILAEGAKVPAYGGTVELALQYNTDYDVTVEASAQSWIKFVQTKAMSSGKLVFDISANEGEERSGKITVTDKTGAAAPVTATITQQAEAKVLVVSGDATVPAEGATIEVDVQFNVDYSVEIESSAQSWIHYIATKTVQNGKLVLTVDANEGDVRSGKVTLVPAGGEVEPVSFTITQEPEAKVLIVNGDAMVPGEGATIEVDVQFNVDYSVEIESSAQSWIHYIATKTVQNGKIVLTVDANEGDLRTGRVTVIPASGEVDPVAFTITQEEKTIIDAEQPASVSYDGGYVYIPVRFNTDYSVDVEESAKSWITVISTKAVSNGLITLFISYNVESSRSGKVTVTDLSGKVAPVEITISQDGNLLYEVKDVLDEVFEAFGARNWNDAWTPGELRWPGVSIDELTGKISIFISKQGVSGAIPECIGKLGDSVSRIHFYEESGLSGTLPDSFRNLTSLEWLEITHTSMTALPDVFEDLKALKHVHIFNNEQMAGPIPEHIGDSPVLETIYVVGNCFTGELKDSWARVGVGYFNFTNNCLTGPIPNTFLALEDAQVGLRNLLWQKEGYGFDISNIDIHGYTCWPWDTDGTTKTIEDLDGNLFNYTDVISDNVVTLFVDWAPWCPFSNTLMPQLKEYYDIYRNDGLEVIATVMITQDGEFWTDNEEQKRVILEKGYDKWYNYSWWDTFQGSLYLPFTPAVEAYDSEGYVLFSSVDNFPDPVRNRFGRDAVTELIPFLEGIFGPAEQPDNYTSTDFSKDGEVMTLQKATVGKGINLVLMGDGYTDKDMSAGGLYETLMNQSMEEFFAIEPYKTFRDRFNVYAIKVVSPNGRIGEGSTTALSTGFGNLSEVWGDYEKCYQYACTAPGISSRDNLLIAVMVNSRRASGMTAMYSHNMSCVAFQSTLGNDPSLFGSTLRHEAGGHGFGFLADEYSQYNGYATAEHIENYNQMYNLYGWFSNVDFTNDPEKIRWSAFLADDRYKDEVGIFEGGALFTLGAYRPSKNSMMNMNFDYFNAPSRWAIYKRIMELSGEEPSFDKFLEYDAVNRGKVQNAAPRIPLKAAAKSPVFHPAPPVIMP